MLVLYDGTARSLGKQGDTKASMSVSTFATDIASSTLLLDTMLVLDLAASEIIAEASHVDGRVVAMLHNP